MDRSIYLKVKVKSLAAEAIIIRQEENKIRERLDRVPEEFKASNLDRLIGLASHRRKEVRDEARASQIAYGYLRGKSFERMESLANTHPNWHRVQKMVQGYGTRAQIDGYAAWQKVAVDFIEQNKNK